MTSPSQRTHTHTHHSHSYRGNVQLKIICYITLEVVFKLFSTAHLNVPGGRVSPAQTSTWRMVSGPWFRQRRCAPAWLRYCGSALLPFPLSSLLSSLEAACLFPSTEGSSAWIMRLRCYWCIKLRVWFLSRPCHQSQFARALAECNISLIGSTRKLRRWTIPIREEIIKLGAPGKISPSEHYCKVHKKK